MTFPLVRKIRRSHGISVPSKKNLDRYVFIFYNEIQKIIKNFKGYSILEFGPGDNLLTGLAFYAGGAKKYTFVDRFPRNYNSNTSKQWYLLLKKNWGKKWPKNLDLDKFPNSLYSIKPVLVPIEKYTSTERYNLVCSNFVGEHVTNINLFIKNSILSLNKKGKAIHIIDFSGHQLSKYGDPLLFLRIPKVIWWLIGCNRGMPNRVRFTEYKKVFYDETKKHGKTLKITNIVKQNINSDDPLLLKYSLDDLEIIKATFVVE